MRTLSCCSQLLGKTDCSYVLLGMTNQTCPEKKIQRHNIFNDEGAIEDELITSLSELKQEKYRVTWIETKQHSIAKWHLA